MSTAEKLDFRRARSAEQVELRRESILAVARALLDMRPLADVSLREIGRQVGLSKSNVVRYFPTREAVFLTVLVQDWTAWLDDLDQRLRQRPDRGASRGRAAELAETMAQTLGERPRLCELLSACQVVLERNVPVETARDFKASVMTLLLRLSGVARAHVPRLRESDGFEFAGITWIVVAGAWPMAHPSAAAEAALTDPTLAVMAVDFVRATTRSLILVLEGMTRPR